MMIYNGYFNDTILIKTQAVDFYIWLLALLLILSVFATTWLVITIIRLCSSYAKLMTKNKHKLSSKKSVKLLKEIFNNS